MLETVITDYAFMLCIHWVLAAVFVIAVVHKLTSPTSFVAIMKAYHLLPVGLASLVAYAFIVAELVTAIALMLNTRLGSVAAALLLTVYTFAILVNLLRGRRDIDCGCSGPYLRQTLSVWLLVRNFGFIALALLTLIDVASPRTPGILDWLTALAATVTFTLIYVAANQVASVSARHGV
jgi:hypothetical protein